MAKKLNDQQIKALLRTGKAGRHVVGDGLILKVTAAGKDFWRLRYSVNGKCREMTLGKYGPLVDQLSLAEATAEAATLRAKIASGSFFFVSIEIAGRLGNCGHSTPSKRPCFGARPTTSSPFIKIIYNGYVFFTNPFNKLCL